MKTLNCRIQNLYLRFTCPLSKPSQMPTLQTSWHYVYIWNVTTILSTCHILRKSTPYPRKFCKNCHGGKRQFSVVEHKYWQRARWNMFWKTKRNGVTTPACFRATQYLSSMCPLHQSGVLLLSSLRKHTRPPEVLRVLFAWSEEHEGCVF